MERELHQTIPAKLFKIDNFGNLEDEVVVCALSCPNHHHRHGKLKPDAAAVNIFKQTFRALILIHKKPQKPITGCKNCWILKALILVQKKFMNWTYHRELSGRKTWNLWEKEASKGNRNSWWYWSIWRSECGGAMAWVPSEKYNASRCNSMCGLVVVYFDCVRFPVIKGRCPSCWANNNTCHNLSESWRKSIGL